MSDFTSKIVYSCGKHYRRKTTPTKLKNGEIYKHYKWVCSSKLTPKVESCKSFNISEKLLYELSEELIADTELIKVNNNFLHYYLTNGEIKKIRFKEVQSE